MSGDGTTRGSASVQQVSRAAEEYLDGVRVALADLPAPEVGEILDDVRAHLADLTAELGGEADAAALAARLGPPSAYAAELRAAAGYPAAAAPPARSHHALARLALAALVVATLLVVLGTLAGDPGVALLGVLAGALGLPLVGRDGPGVPSVAALPEVRRIAAARPPAGTAARTVTDFVTSLQPAWWVVRAVAAAALLVAVFAGGEAPAVLLVALAAVPVSVWVGYRTRHDRRWLWPVVPLNALAALVLFWLLAAGLPAAYGSGPTVASEPAAYQPGLWQDSEREIRDIRPVDAAGNPLTDVYLFDQDGHPIDTTGGAECASYDEYGGGGYGGVRNGAPYPRGTWDYDPRTGACRFTPPGPLVVAVPVTPTPAGAPPGPPTTAPAPATPESLPVAPPTR